MTCPACSLGVWET